MADDQDRMERIVSLAKRRGFIFPGSEIYGGLNGFWDYGPLGVELKRNIKDAWWQDLVRSRDDMVGLDSAIIMNPKVWEASGHVEGFTDPLVDCKECHSRFRADQIFHVTARVGENVLLSAAVQAGSAEAACEAAASGANSKTRRRLKKHGNEIEWDVCRADRTPGEVRCPSCEGELTAARKFNMMFKTFVGALEDSSSQAYLRPETAQGIFANYKNVLDTQRLKLPFGIAQIGKAFRNEINPRNYTFRSREFEQMEIEFFCKPDEAPKWYEYWRDARFKWYVELGLKSDRLRLRDHEPDELAHYAAACADIEYAFPFGVSELEGVANRTDYDLKHHQEHSGRDMTYFDDELWQQDAAKFKPDQFGGDKDAAKKAASEAKQGPPYRFIPFVIEPSGGVDRAALAFLCEAYDEDEAPDEKGNMQSRTVLRFHPRLAPMKVAVFPLVRRDGMPEKAHAIYEEVGRHMPAFYDEKGAIGRRYRRQDEAGTPFCITVDGQTNEDGTVTVRDRDSMVQERIPAEGVLGHVRDRLKL
jgi:glycyl-tRNA synthetase